MGKPQLTKYDTHVKTRFADIYKWVREGFTDEQIAAKLDIHVWTLRDYKKKYPELVEVLERPTLWETNVQPRLVQIKQWCEEGATNEEIRERLGISEGSFYEYLKKYPILDEIISVGRSVINAQVERSLFKICTGYDVEELKTIVEEDKNGKKRTRIEKTKRHIPPSAQAISFFLRNRMPEQYSERKELILDTKQNEEERKRLFLEMIQDELTDEIVEAEYEVLEEHADNGFMNDDGFANDSDDTEA